MVLLTIETLHTTVIRQTHGAIVAVVVVTGVVLLVCTIVVFNMARELTIKQDKYTFESLEDVCEFMLHLCSGKTVQEKTPLIMTASSGNEVVESFLGATQDRVHG